ncbi:energy transducer TonB [Dysgonomonas sp. 25]|uniref:energy transducer TonB n=1 Tax=Dysgonomonas sp. 25 TaxID=2302933 RepID=UPI0013D393A3|nr:energy transducer TonB [Dysgonomonas sp. 25]NDV69723.1 energy transducer TonB [Dysgonomonas sp. 25]
MGKDINIDSSEWVDLVFDGRNKQYGAYHLRQTSDKRYVVAYIAVIIFVILLAVVPRLISAVSELANRNRVENIDEDFALSKVEMDQQVPEENIVKEEVAPPPPPLKSTIKFTPPVIKKDEEVAEDKEMKAVSEVLETKLQVSMADVKGTDEKFGVDIATLKDHKVVMQEKPQEKPFTTVEQMPTFPGGEGEMNKFIRNNLKYPISAQENSIQGRVTVRFVVTASGEISDVRVLKGIDPACDREAVRVVKSMPKWIPGKQNGRQVAVYFTLPIVFKLQ